jgi:ribonuclease D
LLIENTPDLAMFIKDIGTPPYVTVDTEFMSEKTYYPQLCLIQIAHGTNAAVIDLLSDLDVEPLIAFLKNPNIVKVFHAADQDIAILWNEFELIPSPVFDTQIAAMVCGFGDQVSYGRLVKAFTGAVLDKSSQLVDWSKRPLRDRDVRYALADVTQLCQVYEGLKVDIDKRDRASWIAEEMQNLLDPKRYEYIPETQMRKLRLRSQTPRRLARLRELLSWRDERAKTKNLPRSWVLKDTTLRDMASNPPRTIKDLGRVRGIGNNAQGTFGQEILQRIRVADNLPLADCPAVDAAVLEEPAPENAIVLLRALLKQVSEIHEVAPRLLATKSDLEQIALGDKSRLDKGWRQEVFGRLASNLVAGKIALTLVNDKIELIDIK